MAFPFSIGQCGVPKTISIDHFRRSSAAVATVGYFAFRIPTIIPTNWIQLNAVYAGNAFKCTRVCVLFGFARNFFLFPLVCLVWFMLGGKMIEIKDNQ